MLFPLIRFKVIWGKQNYKCFLKQNISEDGMKSVLFISIIYIGYMLKSYKEPTNVI